MTSIVTTSTTTDTSNKSRRQPPPEPISVPPNTQNIPVASSVSSEEEFTSPVSPTILRDFDRYPKPGDKNETVSMIMNRTKSTTATSPSQNNNHNRTESNSSSISSRLARGEISISGPEGFKHLAHTDASKNNKGPPVRSYRESKIAAATASESSLSSANEPSSSPGMSQQVNRRFSTRTKPENQSTTNANNNRKSRLPWKNKDKRNSSSIPNVPTISEPILEYSTSELVPETRQSRYSTSLERNGSRQESHHHHGLGESITFSGPGHLFEEEEPPSTVPSTATAATPNTTSDVMATHDTMEIHKYRQMLRDSEEQRRNVVIEYQQKLDAERQRNLELKQKLDEWKTKNPPPPQQHKPLTDSEMSAKVKALESQRDVLREALNTLRKTKNLEITEYKLKAEQRGSYIINQKRASDSSKNTLVSDENSSSNNNKSHHRRYESENYITKINEDEIDNNHGQHKRDASIATTNSSSSREGYFNYRTGIRPFLPTANPIYRFSKTKSMTER